MNTLKGQTVGQMVAEDYRKANIFKGFGIDFCCNGDITIDAACAKQEVEPDELLAELENLSREGSTENNYNLWTLDFLVDYIVNNHHQYLRDNLPEIKFYAKTVEKVHGGGHSELLRIYTELLKLSDEMMTHMDEEEKQLFPFIKSLVSDGENSDLTEETDSKEIIDLMQHEHKQVGGMLGTIRELSSDYQTPEDACTTYKVFYENLAALDDDLHKHIHLENNILFPKALELSRGQN